MSESRADLLEEAEHDLRETLTYLLEEASDEVMERFARSVFQTASLLAALPEIGRRCGFVRDARIRRFPVKGFRNWLIFYRPAEGGIEVLRILSTKRAWASLLE